MNEKQYEALMALIDAKIEDAVNPDLLTTDNIFNAEKELRFLLGLPNGN